MQKIVTNLWFSDAAEEAVRFYVSLLPDSDIISISRYGEASAKAAERPLGSVMAVSFRLAGQDFLAINGGDFFKLSPAISLQVRCDTQEEIDQLWNALLDGGGQAMACGWLTDRFGLTWQINPAELEKMAVDDSPEKVERVMVAMLGMTKLDLAALKKAYDGG